MDARRALLTETVYSILKIGTSDADALVAELGCV
jgi:hypothetical protein